MRANAKNIAQMLFTTLYVVILDSVGTLLTAIVFATLQAIQLALLVLPLLQEPILSAVGVSVSILRSHTVAAFGALQL